jgi:hypothetical protein
MHGMVYPPWHYNSYIAQQLFDIGGPNSLEHDW